MSVPSRQLVREALSMYLKSKTDGAVAPEAIFPYQIGDFGTLSPVLRILSTGIERQKISKEKYMTSMYFDVQVWVLAGDTSLNWTEQQAENKLDEVVGLVVDAIATGCTGQEAWSALETVGRSEVTPEILGGKKYLWEPLEVMATLLG